MNNFSFFLYFNRVKYTCERLFTCWPFQVIRRKRRRRKGIFKKTFHFRFHFRWRSISFSRRYVSFVSSSFRRFSTMFFRLRYHIYYLLLLSTMKMILWGMKKEILSTKVFRLYLVDKHLIRDEDESSHWYFFIIIIREVISSFLIRMYLFVDWLVGWTTFWSENNI